MESSGGTITIFATSPGKSRVVESCVSSLFVGFIIFASCLIVIAGGSDFTLLRVGLGPIS
jgi:hypothetical protein